jgi:hypothetical protein
MRGSDELILMATYHHIITEEIHLLQTPPKHPQAIGEMFCQIGRAHV